MQNEISPTSVKNILSAADDLDALGYSGIFRYWEIYTLRNIHENEIPEKVLTNLEARFSYYVSSFGFLDSLLSEQQKRYEIIKDFYANTRENHSGSKNTNSSQSTQTIIEYFYKLVRNDGISPEEISSIIEPDCKDQKINDFFRNFTEEWRLGAELLRPPRV